MSKLLGERELSRTASQLPISWYFDQAQYQREIARLFQRGPGYVGHRLMVPNQHDFRALESKDGAWALVNNGASVEVVSNVCRHRQAVMLKGAGQLPSGNIVCPLHRWTYDAKGSLLGAPHFAEQPCLHLPRKALSEWNGMLFEGDSKVVTALSQMKWTRDFDFSNHVLDRVDVVEYNFNWKTFIEVYLEDYHVVPFHPGLGNFVDCESLEWEFGDWYSVQVVGVNRGLTRPGTEAYKQYHDKVLALNGGTPPPYGAIWLTIYPNITVEWYPHVLVISTIVPRGPDKCTNVVEFYYTEEVAYFERELVEVEQKAYAETALEDEEICQRMNDGRRLLWNEGRDEQGPYQSPMEDGMVHFHEFLRRELAGDQPVGAV